MGIGRERELLEIIKTNKNPRKMEMYSIHFSISSIMDDIHYM